MSQRLTEMAIDRVSLVDKGANGRVIALLKRQEVAVPDVIDPPADGPGLVAWFRKAADALNARLQPVPIAKAATFAEVIAGQELQDALWDSWYTLEDVLWSAIYAYDENGQALSTEAKTALVAQDLDEFRTYLLAQMASNAVAKSDPGSPDQRRLGAMVRKVGKKISGDRLARLNTAAEAINSVLDEVAEVVEIEEAPEAEEMDVNKAELVEAITDVVTKAQAPLVERLDAIEKAKTVVKVDVTEGGDEGGEDGPVTLETIGVAVEKIFDRLESLEGGQAVRKSLAGQDGATAGAEPVKKSVFAGILG